MGPALLILEEAVLHIIKTGMTIDEAFEYYRASKEVINMRINVTGAFLPSFHSASSEANNKNPLPLLRYAIVCYIQQLNVTR